MNSNNLHFDELFHPRKCPNWPPVLFRSLLVHGGFCMETPDIATKVWFAEIPCAMISWITAKKPAKESRWSKKKAKLELVVWKFGFIWVPEIFRNPKLNSCPKESRSYPSSNPVFKQLVHWACPRRAWNSQCCCQPRLAKSISVWVLCQNYAKWFNATRR